MRSRHLLKYLAGILLVLGIGAATGAPAGAASTVTINPNPITVAPDQTEAKVNVNWTGLKPMTLVFVDICKKSITDSTFNVAEDCGQYSQVLKNGSATGTDTYVDMPIFRGQDPAGEAWGCYAEGDTAPVGVTKYTTCFVRVTDDVVSNNDSDSETAFSFNVSEGDIPEAPLTILLPVLGTLAALGGFVLIRRRQAIGA